MTLSFIVNRPADEPGFRLDRQEADGRTHPLHDRTYASDRPKASATPDRVTRHQGPLARCRPVRLRRDWGGNRAHGRGHVSRRLSRTHGR